MSEPLNTFQGLPVKSIAQAREFDGPCWVALPDGVLFLSDPQRPDRLARAIEDAG